MSEDWLSKCIGNIDETFIAEAESFQPQYKDGSYWRKLIIKWSIVIAGIAIALFFLLRQPPQKSWEYRLVKEDGCYYMYIDQKFIASNTGTPGVYYAWKFESLDVMEAKIRNGTFTESEFYRLGQYADKDGKIVIFDLDNMMDAVFPEGLSRYIEFFPHKYYICGIGEDGITEVRMLEISEDYFRERIGYDAHFAEAIEITDWSASTEDPRIYAPVFELSGMRYHYYAIVTDTTRYLVREQEDCDPGIPCPWTVMIYGQEADGTFFELTIENLEKRPELDWLASFSVQPYQ